VSALGYRHQRVQRLRRLVGRRSARAEEGRFVIEGAKLLEEALAAGAQIEAVFLGPDWAGGAEDPDRDGSVPSGAGERLRHLVDRAYERGARIFELEPGVLARVSGTVTPQPVMAVAYLPEVTLADVAARKPRLVAVCVDVRDPGNAGTVARSAWAAGADALVCCEGTVDIWNPKAVRSSAGAVLHLPVVPGGTATDVLAEIGRWGLRRWGAVSSGGEDYSAADLASPCALVLGNEASGLSLHELEGGLDGVVTIPMAPGAESLNVGMAAAVLFFEASRQRRHGRPTSHVADPPVPSAER